MIERILKSFGIGLLTGSLITAILFFPLCLFEMYSIPKYTIAFMYVGYPLIRILEWSIPTSLLYWAGLLGVPVFSTWSQLVILSTIISYFIVVKRKRAVTSGSRRA
ncbi:MAG TPA: hypothetical protein VMT12_10080 [Syntrophales bacterium]|nr:hypothetical protein [Syntrophales bacterium]